MKYLFILRHQGYVRNVEHVIHQLADSGHEVTVSVAGLTRKVYDLPVLDNLEKYSERISTHILEPLSIRKWDDLLNLSRVLIDYLRYFDPRYENAPRLRERFTKRVPRVIRFLFDHYPWLRHPSRIRWLDRRLRRIERGIPPHSGATHFLEAQKPDCLVVSPLLDYGSDSLDYLKSAKALGIPAVLCVASWDNLSNKGLVQIEPDRTIVWNDIQKQEAVEMHGIRPDKVMVAGAHLFDHWFEMTPSSGRVEFCRKAGLDPDKPYFLYTCSSAFIANSEVGFVRRWIAALRQSRLPEVRNAGILVRPHPGNYRQWEGLHDRLGQNVCVWPPRGEGPNEPQTKQNYFDSIFHAQCVIGINTSAMVEASIQLKPVFTILEEEFRDTQQGTVHFHYLIKEGLAAPSDSLDAHVALLEEKLPNIDGEAEKIKRFVLKFLRPHGFEKPCAPDVVKFLSKVKEHVKTAPETRPAVCERLILILPALFFYVMGQYRRATDAKSKLGFGFILRHRINKRHKTKKRKTHKVYAGN